MLLDRRLRTGCIVQLLHSDNFDRRVVGRLHRRHHLPCDLRLKEAYSLPESMILARVCAIRNPFLLSMAAEL